MKKKKENGIDIPCIIKQQNDTMKSCAVSCLCLTQCNNHDEKLPKTGRVSTKIMGKNTKK